MNAMLPLPNRSLDELLFWLPSAIKNPEATAWERKFCVSILGQSKRPQWKPSAAQRRTIEGIIEKLVFTGDDDCQVLDDA
ncbi:hypothetical protein [Albimonas pacifica]|uniref:Uncharacterized protein n=1 Tax=Albimonas pacifica TaxID=1114924 RepID=A0A1I3FB22_9RHOB|nr:hypothetical protein [Albimonas pacifica]SFI08415.1 hypothetical protein SAMN05216258_104169 [Albimonas pacifica]|tara:strand:- start:222 stop:461 length:240 start_codon:yes stop_codon:yes gene_type:complete